MRQLVWRTGKVLDLRQYAPEEKKGGKAVTPARLLIYKTMEGGNYAEKCQGNNY